METFGLKVKGLSRIFFFKVNKSMSDPHPLSQGFPPRMNLCKDAIGRNGHYWGQLGRKLILPSPNLGHK